jgi:mono/diheme cytochrome c family protein
MLVRFLQISVLVLLLAGCRSQSANVPSGEQTYKQYCAACHGPDLKGHGPVASVLTTPPPDLTTLAKRYSGKFPYDYVTSVLEFGPTPSGATPPFPYVYPAHGSSEMPTWGPIFEYHDKQNEKFVQQRLKNLSDYLASLQEH